MLSGLSTMKNILENLLNENTAVKLEMKNGNIILCHIKKVMNYLLVVDSQGAAHSLLLIGDINKIQPINFRTGV